METEEIWKPIKGYEDLYEVSNLGRVKRLDSNIILKYNKDIKNKLKVCLCKQGKITYKVVSRIVVESFLGLSYKHFIKFKDSNSSNVKLNNLDTNNIRYCSDCGKELFLINKERIKCDYCFKVPYYKISKISKRNKIKDLHPTYVNFLLKDKGFAKEEINPILYDIQLLMVKTKRLCKTLKNSEML
jgi:DNA-directed RNA polymerase subunit RPC12/RpoP